MATRFVRTMAMGYAAVFLSTALALLGCSSKAEADFRFATPAEVSPPPGSLDRLAKELGVKFGAPDQTRVNTAIASDAANAAVATEYGAQLGDAKHSQYLQMVTGVGGDQGGIADGTAVWIVVFPDLSIPVLGPGGVKSDAVIHHVYVLVSAESGDFINAVYTD